MTSGTALEVSRVALISLAFGHGQAESDRGRTMQCEHGRLA
jgi:hypothetical protein